MAFSKGKDLETPSQKMANANLKAAVQTYRCVLLQSMYFIVCVG